MSDARQVMRRVADEVERQSDCVRAMKAAGQRPPPELLESLREETEFLHYVNLTINGGT